MYLKALLLLLNIFIFELSSRGSGIAPPSNVNSLKIQKELLMEPVNSYVCYSF